MFIRGRLPAADGDDDGETELKITPFSRYGGQILHLSRGMNLSHLYRFIQIKLII